MNAEERAALIKDLTSALQDREKFKQDVRSVVEETVAKALKEHKPSRSVGIPSPFLTADDLPAPGEGGPSGSDLELGAQYVSMPGPAAPPGAEPSQGQIVVRGLKQPLWDTLIVPEEGISAQAEIQLFQDPKFFPDHTRKMRADCNLSQGGSLGFPLDYDFTALELRFEKWANPADVVAVLRGLTLTWYFGQATPWATLTASAFKPLIVLPHEVESEKAEVEKQLAAFAKTAVWPAWRHDMDTKDGKPRRISGTESFRCGVECNVSELHGPVRLKVLMQDTLYRPV